MQRLRLYDVRLSRLQRAIGVCSADINTIAEYVNTAQRRLLFCKEAGDEGFNGTWAEIAFNVSRTQPYVTLPREIARFEAVNVCNNPVSVQNQFYEYLEFGNGRLPKIRGCACQNPLQVYSRNNVPLFTDLPVGSSNFIQAFASDAADQTGIKRVLIQGLDQNGVTVYSQDGSNRVLGLPVPLVAPFSSSAPTQFTSITGIQKDITVGPVQFFAVDATTGAQTLILTMEPGEQTAWYRRYYFDPLPFNCCQTLPPVQPSTPGIVQVTTICKLELIPVVVDTDYLLFQNLEAVIEEASAVRYSEIDSPTAKQMEARKHQQAVAMLNGELTHYFSSQNPAILVQPFGSAKLSRVKVGMI